MDSIITILFEAQKEVAKRPFIDGEQDRKNRELIEDLECAMEWQKLKNPFIETIKRLT